MAWRKGKNLISKPVLKEFQVVEVQMETQMVIQKLSDNTLLDKVKGLDQREKEIVVEVIEYLKEIESRKLHLARGYSSLFAFSTEFLSYSEAEAHIRIQAARLTQSLPEVKSLIEAGEISLSVAASAQSHFRKENLRRKEQGKPLLNVQEKREVLELLSDSSRREAEHNLNIHFAQQSKKSLSFQVSPELEEKIERLLNLMAHRNFDRDIGRMVELLVDAELEKYELKFETEKSQNCSQGELASKLTIEPRHQNASKLGYRSVTRKRYIPRKTRTLVWAKYQGKCSYRDPLTGNACRSEHGIQFDHKLALARGGDHRPENLTLLCSAHNAWKGSRRIE